MSQSKSWDVRLAERVEAGDLGAIVELIARSSEGSPAVLHLLARQLDSKAEIRVADLAANALIQVAGLKLSFEAKSVGYSSGELAEVRDAIQSSRPQ